MLLIRHKSKQAGYTLFSKTNSLFLYRVFVVFWILLNMADSCLKEI